MFRISFSGTMISTKIIFRARPILLLLVSCGILFSAGCAREQAQPASAGSIEAFPEGLDAVEVCHIINIRAVPMGSGSAVPIGENMLASCRHNFPPNLDALWIDGRTVPITMLRSGGQDGHIPDDWCVFAVPDGVAEVAPNTMVDFARVVKPGERIYFIGFYAGALGATSASASIEAAMAFPKTFVRGTVVEPPLLWSLGDWDVVSPRVILVDAPEPNAYHGISGGAAVVHDAATNRWIIVGFYRGAVVESWWLLDWLGLGRTLHTVVRPPAEFFAAKNRP